MRAAAVLIRLAAEQDPPLRIALGSDAYSAAENNELAKIALATKWKDLSISADFPEEKASTLS